MTEKLKNWTLVFSHEEVSVILDALQTRLYNLEEDKPKFPDHREWYENEIEAVKDQVSRFSNAWEKTH